MKSIIIPGLIYLMFISVIIYLSYQQGIYDGMEQFCNPKIVGKDFDDNYVCVTPSKINNSVPTDPNMASRMEDIN